MGKTPYNIVATGIGALIGQGIVKGLRELDDVTIYGVDKVISPYAEDIVDVAIQKPACDEASDTYINFWKTMIQDHKIDMIIPGISHDMYFFDQNRNTFAEYDVQIVLNDPELIKVACDKYAFSEAYEPLDLPTIPTARPNNWAQAIQTMGPPPLLLKPSVGEGSAGIAHLKDEVDFIYWTQKSKDNWIVQKIVGDDSQEYTVGVFGFGDGTANTPIVFRRRLSRSGHTQDAEVVHNTVLNEITHKIMAHFKPVGPTNLQFRIEEGLPYLLEINPRFSSSCSLRVAFGFNEAAMCVTYYLEGKKPKDAKIKLGKAQRYNKDYVSYASDTI